MDFAKLLIKTDSTQVKSATGDLSVLSKQASKTEGSVSQLGKTFKGFVAAAVAGVTIKATIDKVKELANVSSDLFETISKTEQIFNDNSDTILSWADTASKSFGQSKREALDAAGTFALFGTSAGLASDDLVGFSQKFTQLASDIASFYNTSPEDAIVAIGAALRGESEPIRKYNVLLNEATLKQEALRLGIVKTTKDALSPQQRVLAAAEQIFKQTTVAQGDFARTSDGLANTQRTYNAVLEDTKAKLGEELMPLMKDWYDLLIRIANVSVGPLSKLIEAFAIEMKFLRGESAEFIKTTRTINDAMKMENSDGILLLITHIEQLKEKWKEQNKITDEWKAKLDYINTHIGNANVDYYVKKFEKERDSLNKLEEQIGITQIALDKLTTPEKGAERPTPDAPILTHDQNKDAMNEFMRQAQEAESIIESLRSPVEEIAELEERLNSLYANGAITLETRNKALSQAQEKYIETLDPLEQVIESERIYQEQLKDGIINIDQYYAKIREKEQILKESVKAEAELLMNARINEYDNLAAGLLSEEELINQSYERRKEMILRSTQLTEREKSDLIIRAEVDRNNKQVERTTRLVSDEVGFYGKMFDTIGGLTRQFAGEQSAAYKVIFSITKAFEMAQAILQLQGALAKAGNSAPWPYNLPVIAGAAATMGAIIAELAAVNFSGAKDKGGMIPAKSLGIVSEYGDELVNGVLVRGPARVTSREDTERIMNNNISNTGTVEHHYHVNVYGNVVGNNAAMRDLAMTMQKHVEKESTRIGAEV